MKHENTQVQPADAGRIETPVRQHQGGEPLFTLDVVFGTVELQERPVFDGNRMGYECRKVTKDSNDFVTDIGPWNPPVCWLALPEPEPERRPWWARLLVLHRVVGRLTRWLERREAERARRQADKVRHIPDAYLKGYRRLAATAADVIGEHCWNCRHQVAYVTWWCDLGAGYRGRDCKWERCHVADELTRADLRAGQKDVGGWLGLPPEPNASFSREPERSGGESAGSES